MGASNRRVAKSIVFVMAVAMVAPPYRSSPNEQPGWLSPFVFALGMIILVGLVVPVLFKKRSRLYAVCEAVVYGVLFLFICERTAGLTLKFFSAHFPMYIMPMSLIAAMLWSVSALLVDALNAAVGKQASFNRRAQ